MKQNCMTCEHRADCIYASSERNKPCNLYLNDWLIAIKEIYSMAINMKCKDLAEIIKHDYLEPSGIEVK